MTNYNNASRKIEIFLNKLTRLREDVDREGYYWRKDDNMRSNFNSLSDAIEDTLRSGRSALRNVQAMQGYATCPCMQQKKSVKKTIKKSVRK